MDKSVIRKLIHDSEFDPSFWALEAIEQFISRHPHKVILDPIARKYVFEGMQGPFINSIVSAIPNDRLDIAIEFVKALNKLPLHDRRWYGFPKIFSGLFNAFSYDPKLIDEATQIKDVHIHFSALLRSKLTSSQLVDAVRNWNTRFLSGLVWCEIISALSSKDLIRLIENGFWKSIDLDRGDEDWPEEFQDVLLTVTDHLPKDYLDRWVSNIENYRINKIYLPADLRRLSKEDGNIPIDDRICRCGFRAKSFPGISLHRKKCPEDRGDERSVYQLIKIVAAKSHPQLLICDICGRRCKSETGLRLHHKNHQHQKETDDDGQHNM